MHRANMYMYPSHPWTVSVRNFSYEQHYGVYGTEIFSFSILKFA